MPADRWLTYQDAAAAIGMTPESLRQRARREHWGKKLNNEGKALVLVPLDTVVSPSGDAPVDAAAIPPAAKPYRPTKHPVIHPEHHPEKDALQAHISTLEALAAELRTTLDHERKERERERLDLVGDRDRERERADVADLRVERIAAELADLGKRFATSTDEARSREQALLDKLDAMRTEADVLRRRPWWRRLAG